MNGARGIFVAACAAALIGLAAGCGSPHAAPEHPTWADVSPIVRAQCGSCHGWTAAERVCTGFDDPQAPGGCQGWTGGERYGTGGGYRFDFYDVTPDVCGRAALALDPALVLAGSPAAHVQIAADVVAQNGARWPRMPPQPGPALPDWQVDALVRWAAEPVKGPPPAGNRPPTIAVSRLPATADAQLAFTAIIDDPDADSVLGVIEVAGLAFLMPRPGSFAIRFDSAPWPAGDVHPTAVLCDGWTSVTYDLGPIHIQH